MAIYIHVSSNIFHLFKPHQKKKNETLQQNSKGVPLTGASMDGPWVSPFLYHQPSPHWKSRVAQLDANAIGLMHHLVFGINFQFHFVCLTSLVSIYLLIHLLSRHCHHHPLSASIRFFAPLLFHSITPGSNLRFQQFILPTIIDFWYRPTLQHSRVTDAVGLDRTYHAHRFTFSSLFVKLSV